MLCQGLLNKQIAHELEVGETTVKAHVSEILRKLSVNSRTQAVLEVSKLDLGAVLALYGGDVESNHVNAAQ
jgi:DNA-binding NarL/FixJ family response regulator